MENFNGQAFQDAFVLKCLKYKKNGFFLEIGSNHPIIINNSYILEKEYDWNGLLVEYNRQYENLYKLYRKSYYIINDATKINYEQLFKKYNFPQNIDYLQIDLEVNNRSTLTTLELLDNTIFKNYTFSVITFEHDSYVQNNYDTRRISREIFKKNGYIMVFGDVMYNTLKFEDWYVHPLYVDMNFINKIKSDISMDCKEILIIMNQHFTKN